MTEKPKWYWHLDCHGLYDPLVSMEKHMMWFNIWSRVGGGTVWPKETWLRLMKPVESQKAIEAMDTIKKANDVYVETEAKAVVEWKDSSDEDDKAREVYMKVWQDAYAAYEDVVERERPTIEEEHRKACPECPPQWNRLGVVP